MTDHRCGEHYTEARAKRRARVEWVLAHKELWPRSIDGPLTTHNRIVSGLKDAGLYSRKTIALDIDVHRLIREAREIERTRE